MELAYQRLRRCWLGLAGLQLSLLIHLGYYISQADKGKSTSFRILALVIAAYALTTIAFAALLTPSRLETARKHLAPWRYVLLSIGLAALLLFGIAIRPEWFYAHTALAVAAGVALVFWTLDGDTAHTGRPLLVTGLFISGIIAVLAIRLYGLSVFPRIQYADEGIHLSWLVSYNRTGELTEWLYLGGEGFQDRPYVWIPRYYVPYAYWIKLVGPGLWEARLYTFTLMLGVIGLAGLAARNLYGNRAGFFTSVALLASATLALGVRIRHDIGLALAITLSLWLYTEALKRDRRRLHFLAGAAMAFGMLAHLHATGLAIVMVLALYGPHTIATLRRDHRIEPNIFYYVAGGLIGLGIALLLQTGGDVDTFFRTRNPRNPESLGEWLQATHDHVGNIVLSSKIEFLLIALGVGAALWRRRLSDWTLITFAVFAPLALGMMARVAWDQLIVPAIPVYGILIGALFSEGIRHRPSAGAKSLSPAITATFLLFIIPQLGLTLTEPLRYIRQGKPIRPDPPPAVQWVLDHVEPGATVSGEVYHFFWLTDYRFVAPRITGQISRQRFSEYGTTEAVWDAIDVDVFIFDPSVGTYGVLNPLRGNGYLESRGYERVAQFDYRNATQTVYQRMLSDEVD